MSREDMPFFRAFISGILTFLNLLLSLVFLALPIVFGSKYISMLQIV